MAACSSRELAGLDNPEGRSIHVRMCVFVCACVCVYMCVYMCVSVRVQATSSDWQRVGAEGCLPIQRGMDVGTGEHGLE